MPSNDVASADGGELHSISQRDGYLWSLLLVGLVLFGAAAAIYGLLRSPVSGWSAEQARQLGAPLMFGIISLLVLFHFYLAQKRNVIRVLQEALIRQKIESELNRELSLLDPTTEVYNRRYLRAILSKETNRAKRCNFGLSVMMLDITGFRRVNESLGQTGGDVVLREIAHLIQKRIRNSDSVIRYGGDEFLLILPETDESGVVRLTRRLKHAIAEWTNQSKMAEFRLAFAIGTARYIPEVPMDQMLELAERRMHQDTATAGVSADQHPPSSKTSATAAS